MFGYKFLHIFILCGAHILVVNVLVQICWLFGFVPIAVCRNKKPSRRGGNLVFVRAKCRTFEMFTSIAFSQCFLSKEIKTFRRENNFHSGEEVISIWISSIFFCGFPPHIFSYFHYCAISACAANHRIRVDIHILIWETKNISKCARLKKWC